MNEILGGLHLLIGLTYLALAVLVPPRATNVTGGVVLALLFYAAAIERFFVGYYRLVGADLARPEKSAAVMVWSSLIFLILLIVAYIAWRTPEQNVQLDRMEKAALKDQEGGRRQERAALKDQAASRAEREASQGDREGAEDDREAAGQDQAEARDHRGTNGKPD
jgi:hypothetical protein